MAKEHEKLKGYKRVLKSIKTYKDNIESKTEKKFTPLEKQLKELNKYLNANGTVSKRKTRTNKAKKEFNQIINEVNRYTSKEKRRKERKQYELAGKAKGIAGYFGLSGPNAMTAAKVFAKNTISLLPQHTWSETVLALSEAGFSEDDIWRIIDYMESQMQAKVPDEMRKFIKEDDFSIFISHMCIIHELDDTIPTEDVILLSQQIINLYDDETQINYEGVIREYHEQQERQEPTEDEDDL